jgi:hypothetical protein
MLNSYKTIVIEPGDECKQLQRLFAVFINLKLGIGQITG